MIVLLEQATPSLQVYRHSEQIDVKNGIVHISYDYGALKQPAKPFFSKDLSAFSGLIVPEAGMKSDYAAFLKDLKLKKPVIDPAPLGAAMKNKQQG